MWLIWVGAWYNLQNVLCIHSLISLCWELNGQPRIQCFFMSATKMDQTVLICRLISSLLGAYIIWAATWQNEQNGLCTQRTQTGHPPSLIRVFAVHSMGSKGSKLSSCQQWRLIRLGGCPGRLESSLGAHHFVGFVMRWLILYVLLCFPSRICRFWLSMLSVENILIEQFSKWDHTLNR